MGNQSPQKRPRKRPLVVAFLLAMTGLLLMDGAVYSFLRSRAPGQGWVLLILSLALLVGALLWSSEQI